MTLQAHLPDDVWMGMTDGGSYGSLEIFALEVTWHYPEATQSGGFCPARRLQRHKRIAAKVRDWSRKNWRGKPLALFLNDGLLDCEPSPSSV